MTKQTNSYSFSFSFPDVKLSNFPRFLGSSWGLGIEVILKYDRRHHSIVSTKDGNTTSNNVIDNTAAPNKNKNKNKKLFTMSLYFREKLNKCNLVPRAFSLSKWEGREKALASVDRFFFLIG